MAVLPAIRITLYCILVGIFSIGGLLMGAYNID
jgi:hypothetical protein